MRNENQILQNQTECKIGSDTYTGETNLNGYPHGSGKLHVTFRNYYITGTWVEGTMCGLMRQECGREVTVCEYFRGKKHGRDTSFDGSKVTNTMWNRGTFREEAYQSIGNNPEKQWYSIKGKPVAAMIDDIDWNKVTYADLK